MTEGAQYFSATAISNVTPNLETRVPCDGESLRSMGRVCYLGDLVTGGSGWVGQAFPPVQIREVIGMAGEKKSLPREDVRTQRQSPEIGYETSSGQPTIVALGLKPGQAIRIMRVALAQRRLRPMLTCHILYRTLPCRFPRHRSLWQRAGKDMVER
jgi:hypothetical protein